MAGNLDLEDAEAGGRRRRDRHRPRLLPRHAGPADRQARERALLRRAGGARDARLRLPARGRHGDGAGPGLCGGVLGSRLRRLRDPAGPRDPAPDPLAGGHRAGARRRGRPPRRAAGPCAALDPAPPDRARPSDGLRRQHGDRARVLRVRRALRERPAEGLQGARDRRLVHRGLPHPADDQGGGPDPRDPQRHGRRRHPGRVLQGRMGPRPGRAQPALRRRARDGRPPRRSTRTASRRSRSCRASA